MLTLNFIIFCCLLMGVLLVTRGWYLNSVIEKQNKFVAKELNNLSSKMKSAKNLSESGRWPHASMAGDIDSPAILGSMITLLVKKKGPIRLSLDDFSGMEEEYVSVYLDVTTNELILSLNHTLAEEEPLGLFKFASDDSTYH